MGSRERDKAGAVPGRRRKCAKAEQQENKRERKLRRTTVEIKQGKGRVLT